MSCGCLPVYAGIPDTLFVSDDIFDIELRTDFTEIQRSRTNTPHPVDGELIYHTSSGDEIRMQVKVGPRGNFRMNPVNCNFPPLQLNFKKKKTKNTVFENQDKLKLVTPCKFDSDVIEEYLIYKMYNQVTDMSLRVRLVKMLYFDTGKNKKLFEKYSFFIEDESMAAFRNNAVLARKFMTPYDLERKSYTNLAVFQYMIGNKDWFVSSKKNLFIVQPSDTSMHPVAIPYDFDFSGFVNADYTKPKGVPDEDLAERRVFKGICCTPEEYDEALNYFDKLKPAFDLLITGMKLLPPYTRSTDRMYLEEFYEKSGNRKTLKKEFLDFCETRANYNLK
ncbi:MAG: hypothetical protein ACM3NR_01715 [Methanosarcina sp.]